MKFTEEQIKKAAACKSKEELITLARTEGIELAEEEAEKFLTELQSSEIDLDHTGSIAGGGCFCAVCGADC